MRRSRVPAQHVESGGAIIPVGEKQRIESLINSGQYDQARKIAERLSRKFRANPEAWFLLGAVCGAQGDYAHAVKACQRTTELAPQVPVGYFNLGIALHKVGRARDAITPLKKALALQPALPEGWRELGGVHALLGEYEQALEAFSRLVELQPGDAAAWIALGNLNEKQANLTEAESCYRKSLQIEPNSAAAGINLGNVLKAQGKAGEAERCYRDLLNTVPDNVDVIYNLAVLYQSLQRYPEAESRYREVLGIQANHAPSMNNLGLVLMAQSRLDEAIGVFTDLSCLTPDNTEVKRNLSSAFKEQNKLDLAEEELANILAVDPENLPARQDRSLIWLQQGAFEKGWDEYESRNEGVDLSARWPFPEWNGEMSADATILVYPEQGVGDEIMFSSCVRDLAGSAGKVILVCTERLEPLFRRSFPAVDVVGRESEQGDEWLGGLPHVDKQISIASLPRLYRRKQEDFPVGGTGYLSAEAQATEKWASRYAALGDGIKVGLSWRGGHISNTQLKRSISLEQWGDILRLPNVQFVNLQYGDCAEELEAVKQQYSTEVCDWADSNPLVDMDDFAAKVQALDLVISIDNSTVHLAGALGVRTWVLQPYSPDWRWMPGEDGSYWYSSVTQYRQSAPGQWVDVISTVADALSSLGKGN